MRCHNLKPKELANSMMERPNEIPSNASRYDIIGDIPGHADALERLLVKLGWRADAFCRGVSLVKCSTCSKAGSCSNSIDWMTRH
jgi:hypothetical protein